MWAGAACTGGGIAGRFGRLTCRTAATAGDGGRGSGCETAARAPMLAISTNTRATHRRALVSHAHIFEPPALWFGSPTGLMLCNFAAAQGVDLR